MVRAYLRRKARPIPPNILLGILLVVLAALVGWLAHRNFYRPVEVSDFESCVKVTGTILETYPEQCVYNGQSFINPEENIPKPY